MAQTPPLTAAEKAQIGWYVARMAKREIAGPDVHQADLLKKIDRILDGARKRAAEGTR
jgi:hypothetical protein